MSTITIKIGPADHGRRMSLDDFDQAEGREGYRYELGRGVISVTAIPHPRHLAQLDELRKLLFAYELKCPGRIHALAGAGECKLLIADLDSERHPDLAIYKTPPPEGEDDVWSVWVPEIVVEVVSPSSRHRDYFEKPEEYLCFGVLEYWVLDADQGEMRIFRRSRGRWAERMVRPPDLYQTRLLPGFEFACGPVFSAIP